MQAPCPCGQPRAYAECCRPCVEGEAAAPTAEALMRSRYTAYTLGAEAYLLATWHPTTRPSSLDLAAQSPPPKWLGLKVVRHEAQDESHGIVEFVARYKVGGRAYRLHETSRFVKEDGRWFYVDGDVEEKA